MKTEKLKTELISDNAIITYEEVEIIKPRKAQDGKLYFPQIRPLKENEYIACRIIKTGKLLHPTNNLFYRTKDPDIFKVLNPSFYELVIFERS